MKRMITGCLLLLAALPAVTKAGPRDRSAERARTFLLVRLAEELELTDEKALEVGRILRGEQKRREELRDQRAEVEERLRRALEASDEAAIAKLIGDANRIDEEIALIPERTLREVQKILTPAQQARLVLFRPELRDQIRKAMRKRFREGRHHLREHFGERTRRRG